MVKEMRNEFIAGKIAKRKIKDFYNIEDPTIFDLRDWFVALHFIQHKSISARKNFYLNKKTIQYAADYVTASKKILCNKKLIGEYFTALNKAVLDNAKCYLVLKNIIIGENNND